MPDSVETCLETSSLVTSPKRRFPCNTQLQKCSFAVTSVVTAPRQMRCFVFTALFTWAVYHGPRMPFPWIPPWIPGLDTAPKENPTCCSPPRLETVFPPLSAGCRFRWANFSHLSPLDAAPPKSVCPGRSEVQRLGKCGISWIPPHQSRKKFPLLRFVRGCLGSAPGPARQLPARAVPLITGATAKVLMLNCNRGLRLTPPDSPAQHRFRCGRTSRSWP